MKIPTTINAEASGNELKGLIYQLKKTYKIANPITANIVKPKSNGDRKGNINTLIMWNEEGYGNKKEAGSWIQLSFPKSTLFPVAYSFKGPKSSSKTWWCYTMEWSVFGCRDEDDSKDIDSWDLLGSNNSSETPYCQTPNSLGFCNNDSIGTFNLKSLISSTGYKHIRWVMTRGSPHANCQPSGFGIAGIDVYGTLVNASIPINNLKYFRNTCKIGIVSHLIAMATGYVITYR